MPAKTPPAPRQAKPPTLLAWLHAEAHQERLKQILADPVFVAATNYIIEKSRTTSKQLVTEAVPDAVIVRRASVHAGVVEFPDELRKLIKPTSRSAEPGSWDHIHPLNS